MRARLPITAILLALAGAGAIAAQSPQPPPTARKAGTDFLDQINSCDAACAREITRAVNPHPNAQQEQPLPKVVEKSKKDLYWQALLAQAIAVQSQSCESGSGKAQPANAAKEEKDRAQRLADLSARANTHIKSIADPYLAEFMRLQISRIWSAPCPNFVARIPSRRDPEDTEAQKDESATNDPPDDNR